MKIKKAQKGMAVWSIYGLTASILKPTQYKLNTEFAGKKKKKRERKKSHHQNNKRNKNPTVAGKKAQELRGNDLHYHVS